MQHHTLRRLAPALALVGLGLLTACGSDDPGTAGSGTDATCPVGSTDCADDPSGGPGEGQPAPGMAMCAPGVAGCVDTVVEQDTAADCEAAATSCDDAVTGDERMNPSITIVQAFADPGTRVVETAPGTVADPMRLFLAEAVVEGSTVTVSFNGADAPCFVVDHVEVVEDDETVVVTVWAGRPDPAADCSGMVLSTQAVAVPLRADLGSRLLLDGSRMDAPENA